MLLCCWQARQAGGGLLTKDGGGRLEALVGACADELRVALEAAGAPAWALGSLGGPCLRYIDERGHSQARRG